MENFARVSLYMTIASALACASAAKADSQVPKLGTVSAEGHRVNGLESPAGGAGQGATISGRVQAIPSFYPGVPITVAGTIGLRF